MLVPLWLRRLAAIERALLSSCPLARTLNGEHSKPYHFPLMVRLRPIGHVLPHFFISGHFKSADNERAMMTRPDFANLTRERHRNHSRFSSSPPPSPLSILNGCVFRLADKKQLMDPRDTLPRQGGRRGIMYTLLTLPGSVSLDKALKFEVKLNIVPT